MTQRSARIYALLLCALTCCAVTASAQEPASDDDLDSLLEASEAESEPEATSEPQAATEPEAASEPKAASEGSADAETQTESDPESVATVPVDATEETGPKRRPGPMIEEIIVTAQKREESISTVPIAINAFSGDDLKNLGVNDTRDLSKLVPSFSAADSGFNSPIYTLRGIGFTDPSQTSSSTLGLYMDEFNLPYPTMSRGSNLDIQRVEVLKGPQVTAFGRNTTAGAINYVANHPTDEFEYSLSTTYGSFQAGEVDGMVSGPLTDTLTARGALRIAGSGEGWQYSKTRTDPYATLGKQNRGAARALVDWQPDDAWAVSFGLSGWYDRSEPQAPQVIAIVAQNPALGEAALDPDVRSYPVNSLDTTDSRIADWPYEFQYANRGTHPPIVPFKLNDHFISPTVRTDWTWSDTTTLTGLLAYQRYRADGSFLAQSGLNTVNSERGLFTGIDAYSLELRGAGSWSDRGTWLLGTSVSEDDVSDIQDFRHDTTSATFPSQGTEEQRQQEAENGTNPYLAERSGGDWHQTVSTVAVFGSTDWALRETLALTTGLRYTREVRDFDGCGTSSTEATQGIGIHTTFNVISVSQGGTGGAEPGGCLTIDEHTHNPARHFGTLAEDNLGWRVALNWTPADGRLLYLSQSRGFKSGSFPSINVANSRQLKPATQEQLDAYELGTKLSLFDSRAQLNAAAFYYDYKDKQLLVNIRDEVFGPLPILDNAPKSRVIGQELELQVAPLEGLFASFGITHLDTKITEFIGGDTDGEPADFSGKPFSYSPELSYTGVVTYTAPIANTLDLVLSTDYTYRDATNATLARDPLYEIASYGLLGARIGVKSHEQPWTVTLWGRNLTDEYYFNNVIRATDSVSRFTGMPVTYGLTITYGG